MISLFLLIYIISFTIHLIICYKVYKYRIVNVGDLIDKIEFFMWFPLLNTFILIVAVIGIFIMKLQELLKLDILWQKFRNIKLR